MKRCTREAERLEQKEQSSETEKEGERWRVEREERERKRESERSRRGAAKVGVDSKAVRAAAKMSRSCTPRLHHFTYFHLQSTYMEYLLDYGLRTTGGSIERHGK